MIAGRSKMAFLFLGMALFLASAKGVYAEGPQGESFGKKDKVAWEKKMEKVYKQLGLTDEQKARLKEHREKNQAQRKEYYQEIKAKQEQIRQELQNDQFDVNKVRQIHNELKELRSKMEDFRLEGIIEVRQILTAEQFKKFMELKSEGKDKKHRF